MQPILKSARFDLPAMARASGVALSYLRRLSSDKQPAGEDARAKLAAAFRQHADTLRSLADQLESP